MRWIAAALLLAAILSFSHLIDDFYQLYYDGRGKDWKIYNDSLNYVYLVRNSSDPMVRGLSWMNLLYFDRALKELRDVPGRDAEFFEMRMRVLKMRDEKLAREYLETLPDTLAGRAERAFIRGYVFGEDVLDELRRIYEEAVREYEKERIDYVDMFAFDYAYFLRKVDSEGAMIVLSQVVEYDFTLESTEVYYSVENLKMSYYPVLLLLSRVLYDMAVEKIEDIFGMEVSEFLKLGREKRDEMVSKALLDEGKSKDVRYVNYLLKYSVNVLAYGVNDYYFLSKLEDVPDLGIIGTSFGDYQDEVRRLRMVMMVSMGREYREKVRARLFDDLASLARSEVHSVR